MLRNDMPAMPRRGVEVARVLVLASVVAALLVSSVPAIAGGNTAGSLVQGAVAPRSFATTGTTSPLPTAPSWYSSVQNAAPSPRYGSAMAYDPSENVVVLFGGASNPPSGGVTVYGDTWVYESGLWVNLTSSLRVAPSPRFDAAFAYDPVDGYLVLFGGGGVGSVALGDTWIFQGMQWTQLTPTVSPPALGGGTMTYDAQTGTLLFFGGGSSGTFSAETWTFSGGQWTQVPTTGPVPNARASVGMTYDAADGYAVLFGGWNGTVRFNDTWAYRAGTWSQLSPTTHPSARLSYEIVYDPAIAKVVLFGGKYIGNFYNDTWTFQGGQWTDVSASLGGAPFNRADESLTYLPAAGAVMMFGGQTFFPASLSDTWFFGTLATPSSSPTAGNNSTTPGSGSVDLGSSSFLVGLSAGLVVGGAIAATALLVGFRRRGKSAPPDSPPSQ